VVTPGTTVVIDWEAVALALPSVNIIRCFIIILLFPSHAGAISDTI